MSISNFELIEVAKDNATSVRIFNKGVQFIIPGGYVFACKGIIYVKYNNNLTKIENEFLYDELKNLLREYFDMFSMYYIEDLYLENFIGVFNFNIPQDDVHSKAVAEVPDILKEYAELNDIYHATIVDIYGGAADTIDLSDGSHIIYMNLNDDLVNGVVFINSESDDSNMSEYILTENGFDFDIYQGIGNYKVGYISN